eukprot:s1369_g5.t1
MLLISRIQQDYQRSRDLVFNVAFHPILPGIICSGSDDRSIRVWNWTPAFNGQRELRKLLGHTSYVRGLLWHTELPQILFSGSWDATIRVWDVEDQRCLYTSYEHHADVYGVAVHPERPFFLVSSSRDTTIRLWIFEDYPSSTLQDLARPMLIESLVRPESMSELLGNSLEEVLATFQAPPGSHSRRKRLYGEASQRLATELAASGGIRPVSIQVYQKILNFFMYRRGLEERLLGEEL